MLSLSNLNWRPGIWNPSFIGWVTVSAYFSAALLCALYASNLYKLPKLQFSRQNFHFWLILAVIMFLLGVIKQFNLLNMFAEVGRSLSHIQGWYEKRRIFQKWFLFFFVLGSLSVLMLLLWLFRNNIKQYGLALMGISSLLIFNIVRSVSHHKIDVLLNRSLAGARINWILELSGIALVALAVFLDSRGL